MVSIDWAAFYIPHPSKAEKGGEDAYFYLESEGMSAAAVFDGVGGWNEEGVDPRIWAESMAVHTRDALITEPGIISALDTAYQETLNAGIQGSCTAIVVKHLGPSLVGGGGNTLQYANLGDSGVSIYRNGRLFFETNEQSLGFNYPYQLSSDNAETPQDADRGSVPLKTGDIIVVASDGLWDNLYHVEIAKLLSSAVDAQEMAERITIAAYQASNDDKRWAPFGQKAVESLYADRNPDDVDWESEPAPLTQWLGGKGDDIAVIVGTVY